MFIQTQDTPNPATVKFIPGEIILEGTRTLDFSSEQEAVNAPLVKRMFRIVGVVRVFLGNDFISVTKADDTDWSVLKPMILAALMEHLSTGQVVVNAEELSRNVAHDDVDNDVVSQIKQLLEERVRPMVAMDGGNIIFDRFEDGVVYLHMQGACSNCPSAAVTLKSGVEKMLRHYVPEVLEVRAS